MTEKKLTPQQQKFKDGAPGPGRPVGSRAKFAEEFIKDYLADWTKNGAAAIAACREKDVSAYVRVAAMLLPKEININNVKGAELERFLEQFDDKQLADMLTGLVAARIEAGKPDPAPQAGTEPDSVH